MNRLKVNEMSIMVKSQGSMQSTSVPPLHTPHKYLYKELTSNISAVPNIIYCIYLIPSCVYIKRMAKTQTCTLHSLIHNV